MTSIDPINVNTAGAGGVGQSKVNPNVQPQVKEQAQAETTEAQHTPVNPDEVFAYMNASATANMVPKTVNPSKYVDSASAERIAGFMQGFEDKVAEGLAAFDADFGSMDVSDGAKMNVVLNAINSQM